MGIQRSQEKGAKRRVMTQSNNPHHNQGQQQRPQNVQQVNPQQTLQGQQSEDNKVIILDPGLDNKQQDIKPSLPKVDNVVYTKASEAQPPKIDYDNMNLTVNNTSFRELLAKLVTWMAEDKITPGRALKYMHQWRASMTDEQHFQFVGNRLNIDAEINRMRGIVDTLAQELPYLQINAKE